MRISHGKLLESPRGCIWGYDRRPWGWHNWIPHDLEILNIYFIMLEMNLWLESTLWDRCNPFVIFQNESIFSKVTNSCRMLAHYICASILHGLMTFQKISKDNIWNVTNSCRMLAQQAFYMDWWHFNFWLYWEYELMVKCNQSM